LVCNAWQDGDFFFQQDGRVFPLLTCVENPKARDPFKTDHDDSVTVGFFSDDSTRRRLEMLYLSMAAASLCLKHVD
jgi:hypothetical protein